MTDKEIVRAIVIDSLRGLSEQRQPARRFEVSADCGVYGAGGALDSLELVNFVVEVEQRLEEQLGVVITLADERAVSEKRSPFRNVSSFVDFIIVRMDEHAARPEPS